MNRLALFDFDGVIFDSTEAKTQSFIDVYKNEATDQQLKQIHDYHTEHFGVNRRNKFIYYERELFGRGEELVERRCEEFKQALSKRVINQKVFSNVDKLLKYLADNNILMIVVSGAPEEEIREILEKNQLNTFFKDIYDGKESKVNHIQHILNKEGYTKDETIFFGDALTDYNAALTCGLKFVAVNANFTRKKNEILRVETIDELFFKREQLLSIINE